MIEARLEEGHGLLFFFDALVLVHLSNVLEINHFAVLVIVNKVVNPHLQVLIWFLQGEYFVFILFIFLANNFFEEHTLFIFDLEYLLQRLRHI